MDKVIRNIIDQDLSGADLNYVTHKKCPVHLYKDLIGKTDIREVVGPNNACFILFPVQNSLQGHWIGIILHEKTNTVEHYDSYGLSWTEEIKYSDDPIVNRNVLGQLYKHAMDQGYKVVYNQTRFQVMKEGINCCGKHVGCRIRFKYLDLDQYRRLMLNQKMSPDYLVTILCLFSLDEDQEEHKLVSSITSQKQFIGNRRSDD